MRGRDELYKRMKVSIKQEKMLMILLKTHPNRPRTPDRRNTLSDSLSFDLPAFDNTSVYGMNSMNSINPDLDIPTVYHRRDNLPINAPRKKKPSCRCCTEGFVYGQVPSPYIV